MAEARANASRNPTLNDKAAMHERLQTDGRKPSVPATPMGDAARPELPARKGSQVPLQPPEYEDAPPSYEDAIATVSLQK